MEASGFDAEPASTIFIGKWTVKIMDSLRKGSRRHGQLRRDLGNISQRMLTRTLRSLESSGLIAREVTRSKSVVVEYSLTRLGRTFVGPLSVICRWANSHEKELSAVVRLHEKPEEGRSRRSPAPPRRASSSVASG
jgi:DNA-binding HxlR family transcriptional regulator